MVSSYHYFASNIDGLPCHLAVSCWQRSPLQALGFVCDEETTELGDFLWNIQQHFSWHILGMK